MQGLQSSTTVVPGVPPYRVVSQQGGPCGPEVFSMTAEESRGCGLTALVRLIALGSLDELARGGLARELAMLHTTVGVRRIAVPLAGGIKKVAGARAGEGSGALGILERLDIELQHATGGECCVVAAGDGNADALLVIDGNLEPVRLAEELSRVSFRGSEGRDAYILVPGEAGPAAAVGWRALAQHDARLQGSLREAAVQTGRIGRELQWEDLPPYLWEVVATCGLHVEAYQERVSRMVNQVVCDTADEWNIWYGRLLAYRRENANSEQGDSVPLDALVHGHALGKWVAGQFLEWRWGGLSAERRQLLLQGGLSFSDEKDRTFAEGLEAFERHVEEQGGDPYVPAGYFTPSGFALGAWADAQRAAWRKGRLGAEQMYLLDAVGFTPVAHPDDPDARAVTLLIEATLRDNQCNTVRAREQCFRKLVLRHHPSRLRSKYAEVATQFLAGYRDWFLAPPAPPDL